MLKKLNNSLFEVENEKTLLYVPKLINIDWDTKRHKMQNRVKI